MPRPATAHPRPPAPAELRLASIDVGSNSLHMAIAQADPDGGITTLWRMKEMVGLGRMSFPSRRLSANAMDAAVATLRHFQQAAHKRGCEKVIAIATSAVREAENGGDFLERCRQELKLNVRVVSAREEARLIYLGVRHAVALKSYPNLFIDVGGGSVEFIVADEHKPLLLESRKLGAARMTAKCVHSDPVNEHDLGGLRRAYDRELTPLVESIKTLGPKHVVGSSGTIENLAAMCAALYGTKRDAIPRDAMAKLTKRLIASKTKERAKLQGLDDQRKDQIVAGALLIHELFERLDVKEMRLSPTALREGILLDYLSRHLPDLRIRKEVPDVRRRSVLDLARRCDWHQHHSEHVTKLVLRMFDQLAPLHKLGLIERELVEYGSLLHDIGWHISKDKHHKHSQYLILHGGLKGFSAEEVAVVANIARYHRKGTPKPTHEAYESLQPPAKKIVRVGAALLRIADGLDRSHASAVQDVKVRVGKQKVEMQLHARGDAELEIWGARRKMDLFADEFDRSVSFEQAD
ncbi:MAG TPA: Ppx/GppA phosphatase family protein [Tepidisphaeraceae bacterium]|nr:Ppx/GppA phosphatase family protein [Tepidisphaeraceae bacterium]